MMSDDEAEEEEPAEVLAASAAEDLLYQQAEAANHLPPAMVRLASCCLPLAQGHCGSNLLLICNLQPPGNWAAESLGGGDEAASGYRQVHQAMPTVT